MLKPPWKKLIDAGVRIQKTEGASALDGESTAAQLALQRTGSS